MSCLDSFVSSVVSHLQYCYCWHSEWRRESGIAQDQPPASNWVFFGKHIAVAVWLSVVSSPAVLVVSARSGRCHLFFKSWLLFIIRVKKKSLSLCVSAKGQSTTNQQVSCLHKAQTILTIFIIKNQYYEDEHCHVSTNKSKDA